MIACEAQGDPSEVSHFGWGRMLGRRPDSSSEGCIKRPVPRSYPTKEEVSVSQHAFRGPGEWPWRKRLSLWSPGGVGPEGRFSFATGCAGGDRCLVVGLVHEVHSFYRGPDHALHILFFFFTATICVLLYRWCWDPATLLSLSIH